MSQNKKRFLAFALTLSSFSVFADGNNAGTVHFTGEIIEPSCVIDGNSGKDNNVPLGSYPSSLFEAPGDKSTPMPFTIALKDCPVQTDGLNHVQLTFEGITEPNSNAQLLTVSAITTAGSTAATNVGIAVSKTDAPDTPLKLDGSEDQIEIALPDYAGDAISMDFIARYEAFAIPVTAGPADADMTVNILYR